jgi:predicted nucleotidyltransferase
VVPGVEQRIVDVCRAQPGIAAVYLFGSVARGTARPASDVDLAVLFEGKPESRLDGTRLTLEAELERALARPVGAPEHGGLPQRARPWLDDVDLGVVRDILARHLGDLSAFVASIRHRTATAH